MPETMYLGFFTTFKKFFTKVLETEKTRKERRKGPKDQPKHTPKPSQPMYK